MATNNSINNAIVANNFSLPNTNTAGTEGIIRFGGNRWINNAGTNNTFVGQGSGNTTITGINTTGIGLNSLSAVTSGNANTFVGSASGSGLTTGTRNTGVGFSSLLLTTTGTDNIVLGYTAGQSFTGADSSNIAIGNVGVAGQSNTIRLGDYGTSTGQQNKCYIAAAYSNYGTNNTFVGEVAGNATLSGQRNACVGTSSMAGLTTGSANGALGYLALNACTTGFSNVAIGSAALSVLTTGNGNVAVGTSAGLALTSGLANVAVGLTSLSQLTTGSNNTAIGYQSGRNYTGSESDNIAIGYNVGILSDSNTIRLGSYGSGTGQQNKCYIAAAYSNYGTNNTFIGETTGNTTLTGTGNVGVGKTAISALTTGGNNSIVGFLGGASITTGTNNSGIGVQSLNTLSTGTFNSAVGSVALQALATGSYNIAMGYQSGLSYTGAESSNIVIGSQGTVGESNVIRIGTDGTGTQQQSQMFTAGSLTSARGITATTGNIATTNGSLIAGNTAASTSSSELDFNKSRSGGVITSGDVLGLIAFEGHDGSGYVVSSQIKSTSSGTIATNRVASNLEFFTHPDSTTASTQRMTINSAGDVTINSPDSGTAFTVSGGGASITGTTTINTTGSATTTIGTGGTGAVNIGNATGNTSVTGTLTTSAGITATTGNIVATAGNLVASAGNVTMPDTTSTFAAGTLKIKTVPVVHILDISGNATNTFVGPNAGTNAGPMTSAAVNNVAVGTANLRALTSGNNNTAIGYNSLLAASTGTKNTGCGTQALNGITTGSSNTALGYQAGANLVTGSESSNIHINNLGINGESNVMRIGSATGTGTQQLNKTFISGIRGRTTGVADAVAVLIDSADQLGTVSSSIRFKENVMYMGDASAPLYHLRPVIFNYKTDPSQRLQYGLIAEEVEEVIPGIVVKDEEGLPETVQYHHLVPMLLNELQKQNELIKKMVVRIQNLEKVLV
jgi:trimeric autotransporter adhesin